MYTAETKQSANVAHTPVPTTPPSAPLQPLVSQCQPGNETLSVFNPSPTVPSVGQHNRAGDMKKLLLNIEPHTIKFKHALYVFPVP